MSEKINCGCGEHHHHADEESKYDFVISEYCQAMSDEEVGEVARIMARKYGEQSFKEGDKSDLGDELADVLWVLICIANQTGVDLSAALEKNFDKKTKRDNKRHINNSKLNRDE